MAVSSLSTFVLESVIKESASKKYVHLLGRIEGKEGQAIVLLEKCHWNTTSLSHTLPQINLTLTTANDQYGHYSGTCPQEETNIGAGTAFFSPSHHQVHIIFPASESDIKKYSGCFKVTITETIEDYKQIVMYDALKFALTAETLHSNRSSCRSTVDKQYLRRCTT